MSRAENKADRLLQIEALLLTHPEGLTQSEIARRLGVDRSTVNRYFRDMPNQFPYYESEDGRLFIDRQSYLVNVRFGLHEAMAVHLASRLLATRMDRQNPHAASALRKLGLALERLAPRISRHVQQSADVMDEAAQRHDPVYLQALEKLTLAWAEQRKAQVWHRSEKTGKVFEYLFSPYFIEPYAVGQTTMLIGHSNPPDKIRTLKIERIERVELTHETYEIPADFDPRNLLADAWGIWYTESEPVEVVLKFHPRVARRVQETRWHRSETETELPDGSIEWRAKVAEVQEMLPWIRGWGADVEVMEPKGLRNMLKRETQRLARVYKLEEAHDIQIMYYAHSKEELEKSEWQSLKDHLTNTGNLAAELGRDAGVSELAQIAGLLHDIGKYSQPFQRRLEGAKRRVDHSTAGAKTVAELFQTEPQKSLADILAYCIAGHHTGLPDYGSMVDVEDDGTLLARLYKTKLEDYSAYKTEIDPAALTLKSRLIKPIKDHTGFSVAFLTRMVYSTLVDADFQETETYMNGGAKPRGDYASIEVLCQQFNQFLRQYDNPVESINQKRTETLKACVAQATEKQGFFTLTVPTGGGKTFASMAFALNHAVTHGLKRVIYVIPFTNIIEQNAAEFKKSLGEDNVLEHHSNFDWEQHKRRAEAETPDDQTNSALGKLKLAAENWDIPIVVTTNVQFFESLFANRSSRCRKLHNLAKSVIIFDEAQMLPREYMQPCMYAVRELVKNYGASAVFCTATQPSLKRFLPDEPEFTELAPNPQALFNVYRRVQIISKGKLSDAELLEQINAQPQALCIVNTRKHAKGLFDDLVEEGRFHLSTLMCPAHRKKTLATIRERLENGQPCRVVSTQVMEAGIDVDFPVGYRSIAGLDSIIQAAGRVNREGRNASGDVYVFEPDSEFVKKIPEYIKQGAAVAGNILREFKDDPVSIEAINAYFKLLYTLQDGKRTFDKKGILPCFDKGTREPDFDFKTAAENFKLIDNNTVAVIIPYNDEAAKLVKELGHTLYPASTLRKLQVYTVNIYEQEFQTLQSKGVIQTIADTYAVLDESKMNEYYHPETGLKIPESGGGDALFF